MDTVFAFQSIIQLVLGVLALTFQGYALVDAVRQRADAYPATSNQTKTFWLAILGIAVAIGVVSVFSPLNIFSIIAVAAAAIYLTRVRPAIRAITGHGSGGGW